MLTDDERRTLEALELFEVWFAEYDEAFTVGIYSKLEIAEAMLHAVAADYNANHEEDDEPMTERRSQDGKVGYSDREWNHRAGITVHQLDVTTERFAALAVPPSAAPSAQGDGLGSEGL